MKYLLINRFQFPHESILMLTDDQTDPVKLPTKKNMRAALRWLVQGCRPGDSLVFHFAGHGSQKTDHSGDEVDGYNETLWPLDYKAQGVIVDDEINSTIVNPLPRGAKLHAVIDACHSGTALDLPFLCRMNRWGKYAWEDHRPVSDAWTGTSGGEAFSFSGCDDHQKSKDTMALSKVETTGAMTYSFIQAIEHGQASTYGSLLSAMRSTILKAEVKTKATDLISSFRSTISSVNTKAKAPDIISSLLDVIASEIDFSSAQEPQLTTNQPFDVYKKPFIL
uniref:Peptidase C14 caspase domain-containing protein n=1 Tax=Kalanchoe fedtschenkoi TaxID=63787 RepID=A0A7N0VLG3_KALFE